MVFLGSGLGGVCRYAVSHAMRHVSPLLLFPWATFIVNTLGCFIIGLVLGYANTHPDAAIADERMRMLLAVGFCGGFTTFSSFINENWQLSSTNPPIMISYIVASIVFGFAGLYAGLSVVK